MKLSVVKPIPLYYLFINTMRFFFILRKNSIISIAYSISFLFPTIILVMPATLDFYVTFMIIYTKTGDPETRKLTRVLNWASILVIFFSAHCF